MYRIGICDDGKNVCSFIEKSILQYAQEKEIKIEVEVWYTGEALCSYLKQGYPLDILFLDIELYELSGIEVGDFIRNQLENRNMQIIYISGKSSYAQSLFKTQPMDFLIKPISEEQIKETIQLAMKILARNTQKFQVQWGREYYNIEFGRIIYFTSEGRKIKIIMSEGQKEFYGKLKDILKRLPKEFLMIHQSYIINTAYVRRYTYANVEMMNGEILPISKANRKIVRERVLLEG